MSRTPSVTSIALGITILSHSAFAQEADWERALERGEVDPVAIEQPAALEPELTGRIVGGSEAKRGS